jgi:phosphoribosyl 1,2-cyclic phosphate phosphodiesterase
MLAEDGWMRVTFLGTGTSHGIPMIGCDCAVCRSTEPKNKRLRPSIFVETAGLKLLVDATPDFRAQALRANIRHVDAVLVTHTHADHVMGLDDLRAFTEREQRKMPIYASAESIGRIQEMFPYACTEKPRWPGLPSFELHVIEAGRQFELAGLNILPLPVPHGRMTVFGFLLGRELAYVSDCNAVPDDVVARIRGVPVLVLDALRHRPHPTHLTVEAALDIAKQVGAKLTLLTHLCHELDHRETEKNLPAEVRVAYDGMKLEMGDG